MKIKSEHKKNEMVSIIIESNMEDLEISSRSSLFFIFAIWEAER